MVRPALPEVPLVRKAPLVLPVRKALPGLMVLQAPPVPRVLQARQVRLVQRALSDLSVLQVRKV